MCINVFGYQNGLVSHVHVLHERFEECMDLLLITKENRPLYVFIKALDKFMRNKRNNKNKHFCRYCLQCFGSEKCW